MNTSELSDFVNSEVPDTTSSWGDNEYVCNLMAKMVDSPKKIRHIKHINGKDIEYIGRGPDEICENDWYSNMHFISFIFRIDNDFVKVKSHPDSWDDRSFGSYMEVVKVQPVEKLMTIYEEI